MDYPRWQKAALEKALKSRRVVLLTGPRQCGKTTLARQLVSDVVEYRTLDDAMLRRMAQDDPHSFVETERKTGTLIIDEVQRAPDLLTAVKEMVDRDNRPGQYLLTGSANVPSLPTVTESLAGRVAKVRLRPLTQGEIERTAPGFLERAFGQSFNAKGWNHYSRRDLIALAFRGGFPEAARLPESERAAWHRDYIDALLERDLKDIANIHRVDRMRELIPALAAWSTKLMQPAEIGTGLAVERRTLASYISLLESLYLIQTVSPWIKTDYARIGKQAKIVMTDTGMMTALLGWRPDQVFLDSDRSGKLIETFAHNEIAAQIDASPVPCRLYHYRDREKREIDFLIEREDGSLLGLEIKSGAMVDGSDFKPMQWFRDHLARDRLFTGVVLYAGEHPVRFGENMWAVPFGALWE